MDNIELNCPLIYRKGKTMPVFSVNGMICGHCTKTITNAILALDPLAKVETDIPSKTVKVSSTQSAETISSVISEAGYEVTAMES